VSASAITGSFDASAISRMVRHISVSVISPMSG